MVQPDIVAYFKKNLSSFPIEELRKQLLSEGVTEQDLEDSLSEALRSSKAGPASPARARLRGALIAVGCVMACLAILTAALSRAPKKEKPVEGNTRSESGESAFIGKRGWVVRLPPDYVGVSDFKDPQKRHQIVFFCKKDTDPASFIDEGLYGQLGIVRLEVVPTEFPSNPTGLANLSRVAAGKYARAGEKYAMKNIQVATLPGLQVNVQAPYPRVEAFVLGADDLYFFYGGEESAVWRDILLSLRDAHTEN